MNRILEIHVKTPQYGYRRIHAQLNRDGIVVNRKRVQRLMQELIIQALYPKPKRTLRGKGHTIYPYLLGGLKIVRPHQVWQVDITYLNLPQGFVYLTALIDVYSRFVVSWRLSTSLCQESCLEALEDSLWRYSSPEILNSDQGVQFTSELWERMCLENDIKLSMSHKGGSTDNAYIERFWRTLKYEGFYLDIPDSVPELKAKIGEFIRWYNEERLHSSLGYRPPLELLKMAKIQPCGYVDNSRELPTYPQPSQQKQHCLII
jgi:putative transposase